MTLVANPFLAFLLDPLFRHPRGLRLQDDGIAVKGGVRNWIGFDDLADVPSLEHGFLSCTVRFRGGDGHLAMLSLSVL